MSKSEKPSAEYELRRESRGGNPPENKSHWKRRLLIGSGVVLFLIVVILGWWILWAYTHVSTVRASVRAAVVELASSVDAQMLDVYVEPGMSVEKGQTLARLDDTELKALLEAAEAVEAVKQSIYEQAQAERNLIELEVVSALDLARARCEASSARLVSARVDLDLGKTRLVETIRAAEAEFEEASARLTLVKKGSRVESIEAARTRLKAAQELEQLYALQVKQSQHLYDEGIDSLISLESKKTQLATQKSRSRESELELSELVSGAREEEIEMATKALVARGATLALARGEAKDLEGLVAALTIRQAEIKEARAAQRHAEAQLARIKLGEEKVKAAHAELVQFQAQVQARRAALDNMLLKSPVAGTVIRTFVEPGELCRKGESCILITDDSRGRWIEGYIREDDAGLVSVGQRAMVEVVVGSGRSFEAEVSQIGLSTSSLDGADGGRVTMSELVWVKMRPTNMEGKFLPGMSAQATIRVR